MAIHSVSGIIKVCRKLREQGKCNDMDGNMIADSLVKNRFAINIDSIKLLSNYSWFDTLLIVPASDYESFCMLLAHEWQVNELHWCSFTKNNRFKILSFANSDNILMPRNDNPVYLRMWWD